MTLVTHFYRPKRARKKKPAVPLTVPRIVTIRRAPPPDEAELPVPSATETPRAKPFSIVTAKKPGKKAKAYDDVGEAALDQTRAFLKRRSGR
jgi:hypothetical protein